MANILYIVLDDTGFGACDTFGGLIATPNLTRLAEGGLRYVDFHTAGPGAPTRACLLTGRDHVAGGDPPSADRAAIGAILHEHGYASIALGAWRDPPLGPRFGFDRFDAELLGAHQAMTAGAPWLAYLTFGGGRAPHDASRPWSERYRGAFDRGWDRYREQVLARQHRLGVVPAAAQLAPMPGAVPRWDALSADEQRVHARLAEVHAGYLSHTDAQLGRLIDGLERTGALDDTLIFVLVGDGAPGSSSHLPPGWALAMNAPFTRGTRSPLIVHWPRGIRDRGGIRAQFHHVVDVVPTILDAIGVEAPPVINAIPQTPLDGVPMTYSFDDPRAPTNHPTQHFDVDGARAIVDGRWKAVTTRGLDGFDEAWAIHDLEADPTERVDLAADRDLSRLDDPMVRRLLHLVGLWWAEASRRAPAPRGARLEPGRARSAPRTRYVFHPGAPRSPDAAAPETRNRSWALEALVEILDGGADGPIAVIGGDTAGWSLYLKGGVPTFCYNYCAVDLTYIRGDQRLGPGRHTIRYEFELRPDQRDAAGKATTYGAGGTGRLVVDGHVVGEGEIPRTMAFMYTLDETLDVGCDKGSPVTDEYEPRAAFTGKIVEVRVDLQPQFVEEPERRPTRAAHRARAQAQKVPE